MSYKLLGRIVKVFFDSVESTVMKNSAIQTEIHLPLQNLYNITAYTTHDKCQFPYNMMNVSYRNQHALSFFLHVTFLSVRHDVSHRLQREICRSKLKFPSPLLWATQCNYKDRKCNSYNIGGFSDLFKGRLF